MRIVLSLVALLVGLAAACQQKESAVTETPVAADTSTAASTVPASTADATGTPAVTPTTATVVAPAVSVENGSAPATTGVGSVSVSH